MGVMNTEAEWETVGERIRQARDAAGMSVRELSRRIDVSASHVSQVERGLASFSVRALYNVVSLLVISMDSLFDEAIGTALPPTKEEEVVATAHDGPLDAAGIVMRRGARPSMQLLSGPRWERLTAKPE